MQVHVIGAGITGLNTALALAERGCQVEVLDPNPPGSGTSRANAGQLSYAYVAPLASPEIISKMPQWLISHSSPTRIYRWFDPALWLWGIRFMRACTQRQAAHGTAILGELGKRSQIILQRWRERYELNFDWCANGKLIVHRDWREWLAAQQQVAQQSSNGIEQHLLSPREIADLEPSLAHLVDRIQGGIWTPTEEVGDCYKLCSELMRTLETLGGRVNRARVTGIRVASQRVVALETNAGELSSSAVVVTAGIHSRALVKPLGVRLPLYPLKGYSLTYETGGKLEVPKASVTDFHHKIVCARIGTRLRIAGLADMDGCDHCVRPSRIAFLKSQARALVPDIAEHEPTHEWVGLRPATPDGIPLTGQTRVDGLWINTGHGALGFTLAPASAVQLSEKIMSQENRGG